MKIYNAGIGSLILRLEIFAAFIIIAGFAGFLIAGIIIGMVVFVSSVIGLQLNKVSKENTAPVPFRHHHIPEYRYNLWHKRHHWTTR